jgi:HTH-type transcriptional regulator, sugar sensing transcriptional regulator
VDTKQLQEIGLTQNEAAVYLALLEVGETKTGALVKRTHLHRVLIYDSLESLIQKGLASYVIKENRKYFQAADPQRLVDFMQEKQERVKSLLPELQLKQKLAVKQQQVSIYEGIVGIKSALNNMLKELSPHGKHYVLAGGDMAAAVGPYYDVYQQTKKKNKIKTYGVVDENYRKKTTIIEKTVATIRYYPLAYFPTDTWIYNDKVLIVNYSSDPPIAILITNKQTADSYKVFFDSFWKNAKP